MSSQQFPSSDSSVNEPFKNNMVQSFIAAYDVEGREMLCFRSDFAKVQKVDMSVLESRFPAIRFLSMDIKVREVVSFEKFSALTINKLT